MFGIGPMELGIILVIVVVIFGARRLPEIGSGFGKAIKNFKAGVSGDDEIDVTPESSNATNGAGNADSKVGRGGGTDASG